MATTATDTAPYPTRVAYDHSSGTVTIVVDALPATIDDMTVAVGSSRVRFRIERDGSVYDRTVLPPIQGRTFTDDREAVYNNGVLTISVGTARAPHSRR